MAALNFPDPNVTTTYTNPDTGITYEWSNNTWKAIRSAQTAPELFVDYDGDNMTGDLTFNTDKIVLGATFGTGTFAGNIEIGGDVSSSTAGGVEITSTGTVIANRIGGANPVSYADCFVGRYNGVDTCEIKADGSATFAGAVDIGTFSVGTSGIRLTNTGTIYIGGTGSNAGLSIGDSAAIINYDGSVEALGYSASVGAGPNAYVFAGYNDEDSTELTSSIDRYGSASFAGFVDVSDKTYQSAGNGGVYIGQNQNGGHINVYKDSDTATVADDGSFLRCYSASNDTSTKTEKISLLADGSATFASSIGIGTMSPSYLLDAQYQPNRYFQLRYAKPYAKYDDNAMIDAFTFQNLGTTESGHGSKIEFIVGTSVSSNSSSIQAQREGAAGNTNLVFGTNSSEQMRINSDGWIGIGNNDPDSKLAIADANALEMRIRHNSNGTTVVRRDGAASYVLSESGIPSNRELVFGSQSSPGGAIAEKMRIDSNGKTAVWRATSTAGEAILVARSNYVSTNRTQWYVLAGDGQNENRNGVYTSISSDERLKKDITDASSQWTDIKNIRMRKFRYKGDPADSPLQLGVVAQELESVCPNLVTRKPATAEMAAESDGMITEGEDLLSWKQSIVHLKALKALQEAMDRIETLEAQNTDLLARVTALEAG